MTKPTTQPATQPVTKLTFNDPSVLLRQLRQDVSPEGLSMEGLADGTSVHAYVLMSFMDAGSTANSSVLFECCKLLIQKNAPITYEDGTGPGPLLFYRPWDDFAGQVTQVVQLADMYTAAGFHNLNAPMPGRALSRIERDEEGFTTYGIAPLAAAILMPDPVHMNYLLSRGASESLGVVFAGEPPTTAIELADEVGAGEIKALLTQRYLQHHLAKNASTAPAAHGTAAARRRHAL